MNLLEVLMAGVLFLGSSGAAMAVWSRTAEALAADRERLALLDRLEAEVAAGESRLRDPALRFGSPQVSCSEVMGRLLTALDSAPPSEGVVRQLRLVASDELLQLRLEAGGEERVRAYSPAAFGGCDSPVAQEGEGLHGA
jgi:hypothetical protein